MPSQISYTNAPILSLPLVWGFRVIVLLMIVLVAGCSDDRQPILRGAKHPGSDSSIQSARESSLRETSPADAKSSETSDGVATVNTPQKEAEPDEGIEEVTGASTRPRLEPLDLSLPELTWRSDTEQWTPDSVEPLRNSIARAFENDMGSEEPGVELSGKLHWDESEAAENKPLQEAVMGAEFEIRIPLP